MVFLFCRITSNVSKNSKWAAAYYVARLGYFIFQVPICEFNEATSCSCWIETIQGGRGGLKLTSYYLFPPHTCNIQGIIQNTWGWRWAFQVVWKIRFWLCILRHEFSFAVHKCSVLFALITALLLSTWVWSLCICFWISLEKFCWWSSFWSVCIYINFSPWISLNSVWKGADLAELSMATEHCPTPASFPKALLILISGAFLLRSTLPLRYVPSRFGYADHKALVLLTSAGWEQSPPVAVVGMCKPWQPPGPGGVAVVARSARLCRVPLLAQMSPFVGVTGLWGEWLPQGGEWRCHSLLHSHPNVAARAGNWTVPEPTHLWACLCIVSRNWWNKFNTALWTWLHCYEGVHITIALRNMGLMS